MKSWQIIIAVIVVLVGAYVFILSKSSNTSNIQSTEKRDVMIYFWSETCPHCKIVADFLSTWPNTDKLKLDKREVSKNPTNSALLAAQAAQCGFPREQVGVPFLVTLDNRCITGDQPVIEYFKSLFPESSQSATPSGSPTL